MGALDPFVIRLPPEVTAATQATFDDLARPFLEVRGARVVLDLSEVTLLTSMGLGALVRVGRVVDERGGRVVLAAARRPVVKLLRLTGLEGVLPHFPTVAAARASFEDAPAV